MAHQTNQSNKAKLETALPFSRHMQRLIEREPALKTDLLRELGNSYTRNEMQTFLENHSDSIDDEITLHRILRILRKQVIMRLTVRDLSGLADLSEIMTSMTDLAEVTINFALKYHENWLIKSKRFGFPKGEKKDVTQHLLVVAMGKLGGGELNVSSDVDLIFVYPDDGETDGTNSISNHDFFARLGRKLIASLNDFTIDGYVFRVDMRLRPYGENSPLAISFDMLEEYFLKHGREWERHAWIKSRVIAGPSAAGSILMEQIARPFVYRKYLDYGAYESMRRLHAQLRKEVERREMHNNIKLGPGGIREIEFITQVFQLIRGGHEVDLCIRPTLGALKRLWQKQHFSVQAYTELMEGYCFLRKLEHRLQYLDDLQTQTLPNNSEDQTLIATAMGFADHQDFLRQLDVHRMNVTHHFELILAAPKKSASHDMLAYLWQTKYEDTTKTDAVTTQLSAMGYTEPVKISEQLQKFYHGSWLQQLPESSQQQIKALLPLFIETVAKYPPVDTTLERMLQLLENISQHTSYLALLREHPHTLQRVAKLVSTSQWASHYLGRHPILLDELLRHNAPRNMPDWDALKQEIIYQLNHANNPKNNVLEWQMDTLRHFQHAQVFLLLVNDLEGILSLEKLSDHLTELADLVLATVLSLAWSSLKKRHRETPAFAIIGYGKLGGKELGYASDLDIIFLYEDNHPEASEIYTKLGQNINAWLTNQTSAGILYTTDLRLRPNGASGLLVHSIEAFAKYQHEQAWLWEHQALTRARFVTGDQHVAEIFETTRKEILCQQRDPNETKKKILEMREKMLDAHPNSTNLFDIKHDRGGIIDVEFMVQYLVLSHACNHPELTGNIGNISLLKMAGKLGLISIESAKAARIAYREFRRIQHRLRLGGELFLPDTVTVTDKSQKFARIDADYLKESRQAVLRLWDEIFGM